MKKTILLTILIISLALTGCALKKNVEVGNNSQNGKAQNTANENTQVANPASLFCIEKGGKSQIVETEAGQAGICKFDDGSECDEWAFFRKECQPGQTDNVQIPSGQTGITISGIKDGQTIYSPLVVFGRAPVEKDVLVVELRNSDHETLVKEFTKIKSNEVGEIGDYSITLNFNFKNTKEGFIAVYEQGEDSSGLNLVEIPVKFGNSDTLNWQTFENKEYGYNLKYPKDWKYEEINRDSPYDDPSLADQKTKGVIFYSPDRNYDLLFGLARDNEKVRLDGGRTGFPATDEVSEDGIIKVMDSEVSIIFSIYKGKVKEVYFSKPNPKYEPYEYFEINNDYIAHATFSNLSENNYENISYEDYELKGTKELEIAKEIVKSLIFTN